MDKDKKIHFVIGFLIAFVPAIVGFHFIGLLLAFIAGVGKEVYDAVSNYENKKAGVIPTHSVDGADAIATIAGGIVAVILCLAL